MQKRDYPTPTLPMDVVLFGDQTVDCQAFLKKALRRKNCPILSSFLDQVQTALQNEISGLPAASRRQIAPFTNLAEFVERYYLESQPDTAIDSVITCLAQLTHFIGFFEERPLEYLQASSAHIVGVCTGLLAASAIASATSLISLIPLAAQTVRIAFRLGRKVATVANQLESSANQNQTWSTIVLGIGSEAAEAALKTINQSQGLTNSNKLYISAVGSMSVTVSGCPSLRSQLLERSPTFQSLQRKDISIRGPYHANHLYNNSSVSKILDNDISSFLNQYSVIHPLIGLSSKVPSSTLRLYQDTVMEILANQVHWDKLVKICVAEVRASNQSTVRVLAMGPTALANSLVSSLKAGGGINLSLEDYMSWSASNTIPAITGNSTDSKIAIIGMAGRFPNAADHEAFWKLLEQGLDVHREVPADRFDARAHCDASGKGKNMSHTPYGCFIDQPGLFDPRFFNMSPREATQTDPMQRLSLTTAYEAMEMAGFVRDRTPTTQAHRVATFYGQTSDDWREINAAQDIDTYFITGGVRAFGPGRINYHFGFSGPSFSVDTACSSSMAAIQLACTSLRARDCDTVFAGGMNVMTNPDIFSGLSKGQFLSKTGSCKTYDDGADGYCRGDGVVTLILKRLEDAVAEHDPILGVIAGIATNHSAEAVSITHPHIGAQQFLFQKVMDEANVDVRAVGYVEMHGTGTQAGDGVEMASVSSIFAPSDKRKRRADQPLVVGSVKSNIGHGEAVSGACALVKSMMMFKKSMIPPHCGIKTQMNRSFSPDLKDRNLSIVFKPTPFTRNGDAPRFIFMNNFSAAGGNTATLLEDAPVSAPLSSDPRSTHIVVVSAKSLASFKQNVQKLLTWVKDQPDSQLPSLAYTTTARRAHFQYRVAFEAASMDQVRGTLNSLTQFPRQPVSSTKPSIGFVFTGQGSHYLGMGKKLFENVEQFRLDIEDFDQIACNSGFPSFIGIIDGSAADMENVSPVSTQLAITCSQIALSRLWKSWGITPSVVIGHSLGEYAALHVAGVLSIFDTIHLVGSRAELLVSSCKVGTHGMLSVRAQFSAVVPLLSNTTVERACINGPDDIVFSGTTDHIDRLKDTLTAQGIKNTKLSVPYAFHSSQVEPILEPFKEAAKSVVFHAPQIPVISTLLGTVITEVGTFSGDYLARHCRESVNFFGGLNAGLNKDLISESTAWVELGPHPICSAMIKRIIGREVVAVPTLHRDQDAWKTSSTSLSTLFNAGLNLDWSGYHQEFSGAHEVLSLPSYSFDEKVYWIQYKGNWTLTKGETPSLAVAKAKQGFSTTSVQRIVAEKFSAENASVTAESDLKEPLLRAAITGHLVNGVGLCPSSIYADMALTICDYAYKGANPGASSPHLNVCNMETHKPLVLSASDTQILQIETKLDLIQGRAIVTYKSKVGDHLVDQAKCEVVLENSSTWTKEWERRKFLVQGRVDLLKAGGKGIHHIHRGLAYKLFSALVQYDQKYRGMEEVILSSEGLEATSKVQFQATAQDGNFVMSPYFIDSVCHISGFIMNANDAVDSQKQVYISHGWESMRFSKTLDADTKYASYVKMQPVPGAGQMVAGDVYIFEGDEIIGVVGGLKFQCVPRLLLDTLLSPKAKGAASRSPAVPQIQQTQVVQTVQKTQTQTQTQTVKQSVQSKARRGSLTIQTRGALTSKALDIIAQEVGCEVVELQGPIGLADLGIDSLMSLSISGRFREELGLDFRSEVFNEMPTVGDLKKYLQQFETTTIDMSESSGLSTPDMVSSDGSDYEDNFELVNPTPADEMPMISIQDPLVHTIRSIIAQEMGVELEEISDNTDLATMGMDSLMSLSILGALREQTGLKMNSDLLVDNTSIEKIELSLGLRAPKARTVRKIATSPTTTTISSTTKSVQSVKFQTDINVSSYPPAKSVLLQGNPKTATQILFLLPDGSGSATSYTTIPDLAPADLCVYGLNCPFMKDPESFTIGVAGVTQIYMAEIQRRQPKGPYILGGWSAGGVLAYEMTRQFIQKGEVVKKLLLIDSPCPIKLASLPATFHKFCDQIGLLGKGDPAKTPKWLLPHFAASVRELTSFSESLDDQLATIDVSRMPETFAIWAKEGVVQPGMPKPDWPASEPMPNSMYWLVHDRTDFGSNGWERLVGNNMTCMTTPGNHFSMMKDPVTKDVAVCMRKALGY